jgi:hypothetical protein
MDPSMNRRLLSLLAVLALTLAQAGCSCSTENPGGLIDGGSDGGSDGSTKVLMGVSLSPTDPTLDIQGGAPAVQDFTLTAVYDDGSSADVSAQGSFALADSTLGNFNVQHFVSHTAKGGKTEVTATFQGKTATTSLTLIKHQTFPSGTGLPSDPAGPFDGPVDAARAPSLVYPNDGVLLPPNLGRLEFHFLPQSGSDTLFRLSFENAVTDIRVYLRCGTPVNGGCIYLPDDAVWKAMSLGSRGGEAVTVTVAATDDTGTSVGTSSPIEIAFAQQDLQGGLYYWTTSKFPADGIETAIMRFDFAGAQTAASRYLTSNDTKKPDGGSNGVSCIGCHALSRDGTKVVAEVQGQNDGRLLMWDVANTAPIVDFPASGTSIFESWNPDGSRFVGVDMDNDNYPLRLHDGNTGAVLGSIPGTGDATHPADHPDWSNDGQKIVYVKVGDTGNTSGSGGTNQRMHEGSIQLVSRLADAGWSAPTELVARTTNVNHYYPAFAPDDGFIIFDQSTCIQGGGSADHSCNADTDPTATLYSLALDGGTPIALANANRPGPRDRLGDGGVQTQLTNSFPKWSPFVTQRTTDPASKVMWLTFSSSREYGLRSPVAGSGEAQLGKGTLLWMVAIDPDKVGQGVDPSYPAFALPFQDTTTSNHIAQWTQKVVQGVCSEYGAYCGPDAPACCDGMQCMPNGGDPPLDTCQVIIN